MNKGVYISLLKKGQIKRQLITVSGELSLEDTNIIDEIIEFSELSLDPYAEVVDYLRSLISSIDFSAPDLSVVDIATLDNFWETVFDLVTTTGRRTTAVWYAYQNIDGEHAGWKRRTSKRGRRKSETIPNFV